MKHWLEKKAMYLNSFVTKTNVRDKVQDAYTRIAQRCKDSDHIMCAYPVRVNDGDVSGYVDGRGHGGCAKLRSAIEHKTAH